MNIDPCEGTTTLAQRDLLPHHPHHGNPGCYPEDGCDCNEFLWCEVCWQMWPCETKQAHVAARKASR